MILNEFPDLEWLREQIRTRFERRKRWDGEQLAHTGWPNVMLQVKAGETFRDNLEGPFSLFGNVSGTSWVTVDNRRIKVDEDHFFISNQGQTYTLEIDKSMPAETFNIHFGEHFAEEAIQSFHALSHLLENSFEVRPTAFAFHNRLIRKTPAIQRLVNDLRQNKDPLREEEKLLDLFRLVYLDEQQVTGIEDHLPPVKQSTREEVLKRILLSIDYIYTFYSRPLSLHELAAVSCLSRFHFLRLFKAAVGKTPHQFITEVRLQKAMELLSSRMEINQVARRVGFDNPSSFSRLFYNQTGQYPSEFSGG